MPATFGAATCTRCGKTGGAHLFRRPLTTAQAQYRGYSGLRPVYIESKLCADCRPKKRQLKGKTANQIIAAATDRLVSPQRAMIALDTRKEAISRKRSQAQAERWASYAAYPWRAMAERVQQERKRIRGAHHPDLDPFLDRYHEVLTRLHATLTLRAATGEHMDPGMVSMLWPRLTALLLGRELLRELIDLWERIPEERQGRVRTMPLLLNAAGPTVLDGHVIPTDRRKKPHRLV